MATQMLGAGIAVPVVSARLAHARASTTLNVYAHAIPGGDVQAAQLISGILNDPQGRPPTENLSRRRARTRERIAPEFGRRLWFRPRRRNSDAIRPEQPLAEKGFTNG
jgi:hypothetical protein